jgi:membrane-associated phospholipid phosphatase
MRRRRRRPSKALRGAAYATLAAAFVMPVVRKRMRIPGGAALAVNAAAPFALAVAEPRSRKRDAGIFFFQMWAFLIAHELPFDDPEGARRRLRVDYPIKIDTALGAGVTPTLRLQAHRRRRGGGPTLPEKALTWVHWLWFFEPYVALLWVQLRRPERFPHAAARMAAVFDLGCVVYYAVPTAPPWWASEEAGRMEGKVERVMVEVGEEFWGDAWERMYEFLGGNPWAAMPSLHFATSTMAAIVLADAGRADAMAGWAYAASLGYALVYLGEHYVADLIGGLALVALVLRAEPVAARALQRLSPALQALERRAIGR